ncbi:MAG TPA: SDR family oxidoreductase [Terriglobia bacterium]
MNPNWKWNPVRGEYEMADSLRFQGTGEIPAIDSFRGQTIFIIGSTGFLGKVLLAMILDCFPEFKHLIVLVRGRKDMPAEKRFFSEVLQSPPLEAVIERMGGEQAVRRKVTVLEGDLDRPLCGLPLDRIAELKRKVDIVVNLAGLVDFDPPLNDALVSNVYGTQHVIELVKQLDSRLLHISTAYVTGQKDGYILENTPIAGFFPLRGQREGEEFSVMDELKWCERFIEETRLHRDLQRRGGMNRARQWGWINTYTYTKSMGEQLIAQTPGLQYAIVRPAIVESSLRFPFPGWNEGFTTSAPLVFMGGDGVKSWPVREDGPLEVIPVDLVASGILIVMAALLVGKNKPVYHLATAESNPILFRRLVEFFGMSARSRHKHRKEGSLLINLWKAYSDTHAVSLNTLQSRRARLQQCLDVLQTVLRLGKIMAGRDAVTPYLKRLRHERHQVRAQEILLDKFLPFLLDHSYTFETRNIRETAAMLSNADLKRLKWDPETIDWADYWMNIHTKGIEKWIRPKVLLAGQSAESIKTQLRLTLRRRTV